jgi:dolichol-phosphate mannosyltransferase
MGETHSQTPDPGAAAGSGTSPDGGRRLVSVVTPAFNEADNLPSLYRRLLLVFDSQSLNWEWVVVDDHSGDTTFEVLADLARRDKRVRAVRLARNSGSHAAITCGLHLARGDCAVLMAADLQDPPEVLPKLTGPWLEGAQVVWAVRTHREGEPVATLGLARLYYWLMRRVVGIAEMPATGADFLLMDRRVLEAFRQFGESNASVLALITWMGFRQVAIPYDKQARVHGRSGWSLAKKVKLVVDSVTSFTYLPIRAMSYVGFAVSLAGFAYAGHVLLNRLRGHPAEGWSSLMVAVLVVGGTQMLMMGVLGEYVWRALDESRRRPRYLIEAVASQESEPE